MLLTEFDEEKDWAIIAKGHEEIGYEKGRKEGRKEGIKENQKSMIKAMLTNGLSKEDIIKYTGISEIDLNKVLAS